MAFSIIPNNLGGINTILGSLNGPLSSLTNTSTIKNLVYPNDLASNPAMCHAVQFSIFDYTSGFQQTAGKFAASIAEGAKSALSTINDIRNTPDTMSLEDGSGEVVPATAAFTGGQIGKITAGSAESIFTKSTSFLKNDLLPNAVSLASAPTYRPKTKGAALANISLYMPDTLNVQHDANYGEISMTEVLGPLGMVAQGYTDLQGKSVAELKNSITSNPFAKSIASNLFGAAAGKLPGVNGSALGEIAKGALGIATNPQIQLLYRGIDLRSFSLSFVFTPKSSQEAQTTKDIIDTFTYYSVPGLASAAIDGNPGQYLIPPQLFNVKFVFLGNSGVAGSIGNIFSSALNNLGLNTLFANPTQTIIGGKEAKIMNIQECVLTNVSVDYAPNGWAAYNDGYPIQTTLQLQFKETQILTKDRLKNQSVRENSTKVQDEIDRKERVYASRDSAYDNAGY
jgi:hypothetical protein